MTEHYSLRIFAENLDDMDRGTVDLGVPLLDEVIQIGAVTDTTRGRIIVSKTLSKVSIARLDGEPLQAEIITPHGYGDAPHYERVKVFEEPVESLYLRRKRSLEGRSYWLAYGAGVAVTSRAAITQFASTVGMFAAIKQGKPVRSLPL